MPGPITTVGRVDRKTTTCSNCPWKDGDCIFDQPKNGGFKGDGPRYIGYRLITDGAEDHTPKEDTIICYDAIEALKERMIFGKQQRERGRDGELIKIIAQQGEMIRRVANVGINAAGQIVRPQPHLAEYMKKAGHKVSTAPTDVVVTWQNVEFDAPVPSYEEEKNRQTGYKRTIIERERMDESAETDAEDAAYEAARARRAQDVLKL